MLRIDLHAHTTASDGALEPHELVRLAGERDVEVLAVTDHDTTDGLERAREAGDRDGVRVVPGIELSSRHAGRSVHILGLFFDPAHPELSSRLEGFRSERVDRMHRMVARLNELGYPLTVEEVLEQARGEIVARPHVARALMARGHVASVREAFSEDLIADGGAADVPRRVPAPDEAVAVVRAAGGVAVVAHPGVPHHDARTQGVPESLLLELAADGLAGLEVDHPDHPPEVRARLRTLCARLDLIPTGGSDCHGLEGALPGTCLTTEECFVRLEALGAHP